MNCPNCTASMTSMTLEGHMGSAVSIDVCTSCQAFWFDSRESLKLAPRSTLKLMQFIGEHSARGVASFSNALGCPRCSDRLLPTQDQQRNTRFNYWRCDNQHGRFIRFFDFLREKDFIRPLSLRQIEELRQHVQTLNCSNCGASIDLGASSTCTHCQSPISMLDMKQPEAMLKQLGRAAAPRPVDPALPLELARAKRDVETAFAGLDSDPDWWNNASAAGLVQAGLSAVAQWLKKSGI